MEKTGTGGGRKTVEKEIKSFVKISIEGRNDLIKERRRGSRKKRKPKR